MAKTYRSDAEIRHKIPAQEMTREEVAKVLGVSIERVRQIEQQAFRKIRIRLLASGYTRGDLL